MEATNLSNSLYKLIIAQILYDGHKQVAMQLCKSLHITDLPLSSNKLYEFYVESIQKVEETPKKKQKIGREVSLFDKRTKKESGQKYFNFYEKLTNQQNMLQDYVRTSTYKSAILENFPDFTNKVVMDVGAGSGILSFFAVQAGAKLVYAIEASNVASYCERLAAANNYSNRIKVISSKVEEIDIPEKVDIIISEPMGYMLVNERMLESFVYARRFLKPDGRMFPTIASMYFAPFCDENLFSGHLQKTLFWSQSYFHGVDLSALSEKAFQEFCEQPIVDTWPSSILVSEFVRWNFNFETDDVSKLQNIDVPFTVEALKTCHVHGIASWFDVLFDGTYRRVWLSTAPNEPLTHWYQVRCLLPKPVLVFAGSKINGRIIMKANDRQSYDIEIMIEANGFASSNKIDLKSPYFNVSYNNNFNSKSCENFTVTKWEQKKTLPGFKKQEQLINNKDESNSDGYICNLENNSVPIPVTAWSSDNVYIDNSEKFNKNI